MANSGHQQPTTEPQRFLTQAALDDLVAVRLDWTSRLASAVAHDLGNVVLAASMMGEIHSGAAADKYDPDASPADMLVQQVQSVIDALRQWQGVPSKGNAHCSLRQWWSLHGPMLRQFASPGVRLSCTAGSDERWFDARTFCVVMAGLVIAIDAQVRPLERLIVSATTASTPDFVRINVEPAPPTSPMEILVPTAARNLLKNAANGAFDGVVKSEHGWSFTMPTHPRQ